MGGNKFPMQSLCFRMRWPFWFGLRLTWISFWLLSLLFSWEQLWWEKSIKTCFFWHLSRSSSVSTMICPFTVIAFNSFGPSSISLAIAGSVIASRFFGSAIFTLRAYFDFVAVSDAMHVYICSVCGAIHKSYFEHCLLPGIVVAKATQRQVTTTTFLPMYIFPYISWTWCSEHQP